jgi:hypothetical protein
MSTDAVKQIIQEQDYI